MYFKSFTLTSAHHLYKLTSNLSCSLCLHSKSRDPEVLYSTKTFIFHFCFSFKSLFSMPLPYIIESNERRCLKSKVVSFSVIVYRAYGRQVLLQNIFHVVMQVQQKPQANIYNSSQFWFWVLRFKTIYYNCFL